MKRQICHWINTCEKLWERSRVSCGKDNVKDITNHLIAKASKGVFTKVDGSIYSNATQYSGAIKAYKKFATPINT